MSHQAIIGIAIPIITFLVGWILPNDKAVKIGFNISQFVRRCFGAKLEEKIEDIVDGIDKGMHSDDKEQDNGKLGILILSFLLISSIVSFPNAGILSNFLSPAPAVKQDSVRIVLQLNMPIGIIGLTKSNDANTQLDAKLLNCVGFGPSIQWQQWTGTNYTQFAITLAALLFPQDQTPFPWDAGIGLMATAFNGYGVGIGYNAGTVPGKPINRIIGMLIADVSFWKNK
jgi:hypothetical protein